MPNTDKAKGADYQKKAYQKKVDAGLVRISVWVPVIVRDQFMMQYSKMAAKWRGLGMMD